MSSVSLVSCAAPDSELTPTGDETVTLRFNWWGSESRQVLTDQVIAAFEDEHPNIKVEGEYSDFGSYFDKLSVMAAAGDLPDVITLTDPYMYGYVENGQIIDLTEYAGILPTTEFSEATLANMALDGGQYAIPAGGGAFGIAVNPALFEQAGIPVPDDSTWTWDDYRDLSVELAAALPGVSGTGLFLTEQMMNVWLRQQGQDYWAEEGAELGFDAATAAAFWAYELDLANSGGALGVEASVEAGSLAPEQSPLALGQQAMSLIAVGQLGSYESAGQTLQLLMVPGESEFEAPGGWTNPGQWYAVAATSEHPEEAALFIDFIVNTAEAGSINKFDRGVPGNLSVLEAITPTLSGPENQIATYFARVQALEPAPFPRQNAGAGPVFVEAQKRLTQEVLFERLTPEQAAQQLIAEVEAAL